MNIRIIYDYKLSKLEKQYNYIKNIFPLHELVIYNNIQNNLLFEYRKYNIYLDIISENQVFLYPSEYNILIVNDEYVITNNTYLRRESYNRNPLILQNDVIHFYFCLTQYSYNILKKKININKLILLDGLFEKVDKPLNISDKYLYYEIDMYSQQNNINILKTWLKYYINRPEKLIIKYIYEKEDIVSEFKKLLHLEKLFDNKIYFFKNIIFFSDNKYLSDYLNKIKTIIINNSNYNFIYKLYEYIYNNKYIITLNNEISKEVLDKSNILFNEFTEDNLNNAFKNFFKLTDVNINDTINKNKKQLNKNITSTIKKINTFFKN
jgi:hypothetical protein